MLSICWSLRHIWQPRDLCREEGMVEVVVRWHVACRLGAAQEVQRESPGRLLGFKRRELCSRYDGRESGLQCQVVSTT
jgi:hypothetical protein